MSNEAETGDVARETSGPKPLDFGSYFTALARAREDNKARDEAIQQHEQEQRDAYREALHANARDWISRWLKRAGLSERERGAEALKVPAALARAIKEQAPRQHADMMRGVIPDSGFGLTGEVGTGKTFALVVMFAQLLQAQWTADPRREVVSRNWLAWRRWPEVTSEVRVIAAREQGGYAEAETMMKRLATVPALVLDDLGGERMRAEYEDDWVASMLDLLIDRRHNAMLPTWYTTNLARNEFMDRYGARLLSRLCGENTLVTVPAGPDMRMRDARSR
jgi:DNA replication protein DnaC